MTMRCALSHFSFAAHHIACSATEAPAGGVFAVSDCLKAAGVMPRKLLLPPLVRREAAGGALNDRAERKPRVFGKWSADELKPKGQVLAVGPAGQRNGGRACHIDRPRNDVIEIH